MGVPPHVAVLQELHSLKVKQQSLIDNFISKVKTAIEECDLASGTLSEQRLCQIFNGFSAEIHEQLLNVGQGLEIQRQTKHNKLNQGKDIIGIILMVVSTMF